VPGGATHRRGAVAGDILMIWYVALVERRRRTRALRRAIARLPELNRRIILLTARDGLSHSDVAERLGISNQTVEAELAQALISLAQELDPGGDD
jgi:RNA polymerase sigma-70 factor, ECF subfamily